MKKLKYRIQENARAEVLIEDGTTLFMTLVPIKVYRVVGEFNPDGNPKYHVECQIAVNQDSPEELYGTATSGQQTAEETRSEVDAVGREKILTGIVGGKEAH